MKVTWNPHTTQLLHPSGHFSNKMQLATKKARRAKYTRRKITGSAKLGQEYKREWEPIYNKFVNAQRELLSKMTKLEADEQRLDRIRRAAKKSTKAFEETVNAEDKSNTGFSLFCIRVRSHSLKKQITRPSLLKWKEDSG